MINSIHLSSSSNCIRSLSLYFSIFRHFNNRPRTIYDSSNPPNRHLVEHERKIRKAALIKIPLPDVETRAKIEKNEITPEESKEFFKKMGLYPVGNDQEFVSSYIASTGAIMDSYIPSEGDGKVSLFSKEGAKEGLTATKGKGKTMLALRKIRSYEDNFSAQSFAEEALQIYIQAHSALMGGNHDEILQYATEKALPLMVMNTERKTLRWSFIKSLEAPKVVHMRTQDIHSKENLFAQVTLRFHSQQILAVYDRFGRLFHGSEVVAKDVLEYVVFEKHISNLYGKWRLHAKIFPDWLPRSVLNKRTYIREVRKTEEKETKSKDDENEKMNEAEKEEEAEEEEEEKRRIYDKYGKIIKW